MTTTETETTMSMDEFEQLARSIRDYNIGKIHTATVDGSDHDLPTYVLPASVWDAGSEDLPQDVKSGLNELSEGHKAEAAQNSSDLEPALRSRAEAIQGRPGMNQEEFEKRARQRRDKNIEEAKRREEEIYNKVIEWGKKYPSQREGILGAYDKVSEFLNNLWNTIKNAILDMVNRVVEWLKKVVQWFKDRIDDVANFFRSLFG